ncbi:hypothetical protein CR513_42203, partial [Mucuna pruriens]
MNKVNNGDMLLAKFDALGQKLDKLSERVCDESNQTNEIINNSIKELATRMDNMEVHNKMLETLIAQLISTSIKALGKFPSQPKTTPIKHCNMVTLRSEKQLDGLVSY